MSLSRLIADHASLTTVADYLDGLDHDRRWSEVKVLGRREQAWLYGVSASQPIRLEDFVPAHVPPLTEVVHHGVNTLPLPGKLRGFQKRFCRPRDREEALFGYNESPTRSWLGPGYFVGVPTPSRHAQRGEVVIDYYQLPDGIVPASWPQVRPNHKGLQMFVYLHTRDYMRKVSEHLTVGAAYKNGIRLTSYFVLCREDPC